MKLAAVILASLLVLPSLAHADPYGPQDPYATAQPPPPPRRAALRQIILQRFDTNHDGRLEPVERRRAARALRRLARMLVRQGGGAGPAMRRRLVERYDLNGDGNVGPGEMPPALAKRLRPLDRNGDGWLDEQDGR